MIQQGESKVDKSEAVRERKISGQILCADHSEEPLRAGIVFSKGFHDS